MGELYLSGILNGRVSFIFICLLFVANYGSNFQKKNFAMPVRLFLTALQALPRLTTQFNFDYYLPAANSSQKVHSTAKMKGWNSNNETEEDRKRKKTVASFLHEPIVVGRWFFFFRVEQQEAAKELCELTSTHFPFINKWQKHSLIITEKKKEKEKNLQRPNLNEHWKKKGGKRKVRQEKICSRPCIDKVARSRFFCPRRQTSYNSDQCGDCPF